MQTNNYLNPSWLNGNYADVNGYNVSIDYSLSFACFEGENNVYTFQGDEGDKCIEEITDIYNKDNCTQQEAVAKWISLYL